LKARIFGPVSGSGKGANSWGGEPLRAAVFGGRVFYIGFPLPTGIRLLLPVDTQPLLCTRHLLPVDTQPLLCTRHLLPIPPGVPDPKGPARH
jgi:hypothetical protein